MPTRPRPPPARSPQTPSLGALSQRRAGILRLVVHEYIDTAAPVGSKTIHDKYGLPASPATIRHEMQALEESGLLTHPHTSAGRVPSDQGYRTFVESLMGQVDLGDDEKATMRHQFLQVAPELDDWLDLAAVLLARSLGLLAVVVPPRAREVRVRRVELIGLKDLMALLIVVLHEARVMKQLVTLSEARSQAELSQLANRLNERVVGKSPRQLRAEPAAVDPSEQIVFDSLQRVLDEEETREIEPHVEGLRGVLAQPEFQSDHERVLQIMSLVDQRHLDRVLPPGALSGGGVSVVIGGENQADELRDCTVIVAPYGLEAGMAGFVGLVGPTRLPYERSVASVRYLSDLLQEMMEQVYG